MNKTDLHLRCPSCQAPLIEITAGAQCSCGFSINTIANIPILRICEAEERLDYFSDKSLLTTLNSKQLPIPRIRNAFARDDFMLELGAGSDVCKAPNLIKTDAFVYSPYLDYVVDAHALPFEDNTFDFVYSLAVFEHLHSPWIAAEEIFRVLKPGGKVYILTAFMQHLHGYPHHYFNMTSSGLSRIFKDFQIKRCGPSPYCPLTQLGHVISDLGRMTQALPANQQAQELYKHIQVVTELIPQVQDELIQTEKNAELWNLIAPGVEIFAVKPA